MEVVKTKGSVCVVCINFNLIKDVLRKTTYIGRWFFDTHFLERKTLEWCKTAVRWSQNDTLHMGVKSDTCRAVLVAHDGNYLANFIPSMNGQMKLGSSSNYWAQLYATTSTISTSDENLKYEIRHLNEYVDLTEKFTKFYNALQPVMYKFNEQFSNSGRDHCGYIAQHVEEAMNEVGLTSLQFARLCKDPHYSQLEDGTPDVDNILGYDYALRYSEFIPLNTMRIHQLRDEIKELKGEIVELKGIIEVLLNKIMGE